MEHIEVPNKYIDSLEEIDYRMIDCRIKENDNDLEKVLSFQFKQLDCSRVLSNGMRNIQTIDVAYRMEMAMTIEIINKLDDSKKDEYIAKLNNLHLNNLTFEINNPPVDYASKTKTKKTAKSTRKTKQGEFKFSKEVKAEQSLNRKLKEYAGLNFKIKIK